MPGDQTGVLVVRAVRIYAEEYIRKPRSVYEKLIGWEKYSLRGNGVIYLGVMFFATLR